MLGWLGRPFSALRGRAGQGRAPHRLQEPALAQPGRRSHAERRRQHGVAVAAGPPALEDGQLLLLPGQKGAPSPQPLQPAPPTDTPVEELWAACDTAVKHCTLQQAEDLHARCGDQALAQDVLLVVYAPWCPYCQSMEAELEALAAALRPHSDVAVVALRGDLPGSRAFSKDVLQVRTLPTVLLFPRQGGGVFFKYRSPHRDAPSLLRFMNSLCRGGKAPWALQEAAAPEAAVVAGAKVACSTAQPVAELAVAPALGLPAALDPAALRGQLTPLAAVLGVGLAVGGLWQAGHGGQGQQQAGGGGGAAKDADTSVRQDVQEVEANIRSLSTLLGSLVGLRLRLAAAAARQALHAALPWLPVAAAAAAAAEPQAGLTAPLAAAAPAPVLAAASHPAAAQAAAACRAATPEPLPTTQAARSATPPPAVPRPSSAPLAAASIAGSAAAAPASHPLPAAPARLPSPHKAASAPAAAAAMAAAAAADALLPSHMDLETARHSPLPGQALEASATDGAEVQVEEGEVRALLQQLLEGGGGREGRAGGAAGTGVDDLLALILGAQGRRRGGGS